MVGKFFYGSFIFKNFRTKRGSYERPSYIGKQYDESQQLSPPGSIGPPTPIKPSQTGYVPVKQPPPPPYAPPPPPQPYVPPAPPPPPPPPPPSPRPTYGLKQGPSSYGRPPYVEPPPHYRPKKGYGRPAIVSPPSLYRPRLSYGRPPQPYPPFIEDPFPHGSFSPQEFSPENFGEQFGPIGPFGTGMNPQFPLLGQQSPTGFPGSQALVPASSKIAEDPSLKKTV
ncbi:unnamed protein product [Angiostrongylus costaricensis]|uniref:Extensin-like n=1 Tax=Angiostrongylus costaricensis TaxID=334426 RepID=A0A0R3PFH1_ANGCS|nr:unnamed protein product [Angiostrongylus costaricensis]